jgi:hypothetical protein
MNYLGKALPAPYAPWCGFGKEVGGESAFWVVKIILSVKKYKLSWHVRLTLLICVHYHRK